MVVTVTASRTVNPVPIELWRPSCLSHLHFLHSNPLLGFFYCQGHVLLCVREKAPQWAMDKLQSLLPRFSTCQDGGTWGFDSRRVLAQLPVGGACLEAAGLALILSAVSTAHVLAS